MKASVIPPLGRLITECKVREARDKARLTLETIARESQNILSVLATPLVSTLAYIAPSCPQNYIEDGKIFKVTIRLCSLFKFFFFIILFVTTKFYVNLIILQQIATGYNG